MENEQSESVIYDADRNRYRANATFPRWADIRETDQVVWGTRTFEVKGVENAYDHAGLVSHVLARLSETK